MRFKEIESVGADVMSAPTSLNTFQMTHFDPRRPLKFMSAMEASVVPSLNVLASMTEVPSRSGTSSTMPSSDRDSRLPRFSRRALLHELQVASGVIELLLAQIVAEGHLLAQQSRLSMYFR